MLAPARRRALLCRGPSRRSVLVPGAAAEAGEEAVKDGMQPMTWPLKATIFILFLCLIDRVMDLGFDLGWWG